MAEAILRYWPVPIEPPRHGRTTLALAEPAARYVVRARAFSGTLPTNMLSTSATGGGHALHLGPDEWLLLLPEGEMPPTPEGAHSLVDVSDRSIAFQVEGPGAAALIQTGCPLDLHHFPPGKATRTLFETVEIVLWRKADETFHIEVWRSFASWLWTALNLTLGDQT